MTHGRLAQQFFPAPELSLALEYVHVVQRIIEACDRHHAEVIASATNVGYT